MCVCVWGGGVLTNLQLHLGPFWPIWGSFWLDTKRTMTNPNERMVTDRKIKPVTSWLSVGHASSWSRYLKDKQWRHLKIKIITKMCTQISPFLVLNFICLKNACRPRFLRKILYHYYLFIFCYETYTDDFFKSIFSPVLQNAPLHTCVYIQNTQNCVGGTLQYGGWWGSGFMGLVG